MWVFLALVGLLLLAPAIAVVVSSFTSAQFPSFPPRGYSFQWYREIFNQPEFVDSFLLSARLAIATSVVATALGTMAAFAMIRFRFPLQSMFEAFFMAPLAMPGVIMGIGLLQLFSSARIEPSFWTLFVGHLLVTVPFAIRMVSASLASFDDEVERAAMSLGASYPTTLRTISLPLLRAGMFGAFAFTFIISFDEISISLFVSSVTDMPLPVRLFQYIEQNATPLVNSVSAIVLGLGVLTLWLVEKVTGLQSAFGAEY